MGNVCWVELYNWLPQDGYREGHDQSHLKLEAELLRPAKPVVPGVAAQPAYGQGVGQDLMR